MYRSCVIAALLVCANAGASDLSAFLNEPDKKLHAEYSMYATNAMYLSGMSKWQAFTVMMVIGGIKETMDGDRNSTIEHHRDMLANMLGASTVFVTAWALDLRSDRVAITYRRRF